MNNAKFKNSSKWMITKILFHFLNFLLAKIQFIKSREYTSNICEKKAKGG